MDSQPKFHQDSALGNISRVLKQTAKENNLKVTQLPRKSRGLNPVDNL